MLMQYINCDFLIAVKKDNFNDNFQIKLSFLHRPAQHLLMSIHIYVLKQEKKTRVLSGSEIHKQVLLLLYQKKR